MVIEARLLMFPLPAVSRGMRETLNGERAAASSGEAVTVGVLVDLSVFDE